MAKVKKVFLDSNFEPTTLIERRWSIYKILRFFRKVCIRIQIF